MDMEIREFWNATVEELLRSLQSTPTGLSRPEAERRARTYGPNSLAQERRPGAFALFLSQFKSPLILILLVSAAMSFFIRDPIDASIILVIVLVSGLLGFRQELGAADAVAGLLSIVRIQARVLRDGEPKDLDIELLVPGDVIVLGAGDAVPGDCRVLEAKDLFIDESTITGETFPVEKRVSDLPPDAPLGQRVNSLWMGTHVVSGSAHALVIHTGKTTEFGKVAERLGERRKETDFETGIRRFGYFLMEVTLLLVVAIFAINVYLRRPVLDSFLFSLALAVGLTPQLLPAIISVNLAHGAKSMARSKVIVKRLASIENFGSMNIICSDKTGTLTEGVVHIHSAIDADGVHSEETMLAAYINASYESGFTNPIDIALRAQGHYDLSGYAKLDEIPYDFVRKRLSILVSSEGSSVMVTKGALSNVLEVCSTARREGGVVEDIQVVRGAIEKRFEELGRAGFRTLGVARKDMGTAAQMSHQDEIGMTFLGFLVLMDPPKPDAAEVVAGLKGLGVSLKIVTGDSALVAATLGSALGLKKTNVLTGSDLRRLSEGALVKRVQETDIFAEIEPYQKERIILALRSSGNVVGYMGDGINDVSAIHAADVGISISGAVDGAKDAADIVLLEKDLRVLMEGVREGRVTFANTMKYVYMATSANFGNMFSMAGISLFIPFLPMLPKQILLTNLLTDFPEMAIASDRVDPEMVETPQRWDLRSIRRFMLTFGITSSVFDFVTFAVLLFVLRSKPEEFRTAWFLESVVSASLAVMVVRSRRPFFKSRPGRSLVLATVFVIVFTLPLPYTPLAGLLGFQALSSKYIWAIGAVAALYATVAELVKHRFYRGTRPRRRPRIRPPDRAANDRGQGKGRKWNAHVGRGYGEERGQEGCGGGRNGKEFQRAYQGKLDRLQTFSQKTNHPTRA